MPPNVVPSVWLLAAPVIHTCVSVLIIALLKCNSCTIKFTSVISYFWHIHKIMQTPPLLNSRTLPPKETSYPLAVTHHSRLSPCPTPPQFLKTTNLISVCMDLPILDILRKWNHTICGLLCVSSFTSIIFSRAIHVVAWIST